MKFIGSLERIYIASYKIAQISLLRINFHRYAVPAMAIAIALTLILLSNTIAMKQGDIHDVFAFNKTRLANFDFASVGDWACFSEANKTAANIANKNPDLVLGLGDYAYRNDASCWFKIIKPIEHKMKITIGNHDHLFYTSTTSSHPAPKRLNQYMTHFNMSSQYYSFDHQNVHFISASTELPFEIGSKQYDFIKNDLEKTSSDPKINWIVVFFHRLAYTSPSLIDPIKSIRETFHPLFQKYGVDLVMQGHSHNYQRTYPLLYNATNSLNPIVTDKNTTNYYNPKGQIFTITGTGGSPFIHNFTEPASPFTATQFSGKFGFLDINVTHNGTVLEGKFYDNMGAVDDHFTIEKSMDKR